MSVVMKSITYNRLLLVVISLILPSLVKATSEDSLYLKEGWSVEKNSINRYCQLEYMPGPSGGIALHIERAKGATRAKLSLSVLENAENDPLLIEPIKFIFGSKTFAPIELNDLKVKTSVEHQMISLKAAVDWRLWQRLLSTSDKLSFKSANSKINTATFPNLSTETLGEFNECANNLDMPTIVDALSGSKALSADWQFEYNQQHQCFLSVEYTSNNFYRTDTSLRFFWDPKTREKIHLQIRNSYFDSIPTKPLGDKELTLVTAETGLYKVHRSGSRYKTTSIDNKPWLTTAIDTNHVYEQMLSKERIMIYHKDRFYDYYEMNIPTLEKHNFIMCIRQNWNK